MAIEDLTAGMKQLKASEHADLKLSEDVKKQYVTAAETLRQGISTAREMIASQNLGSLGEVGTLQSASQTKSNLQNDAQEISKQLSDYEDYLTVFADTVKQAADNIIKNS